MKIYNLIENGIEYKVIECIGPLEYTDAKCEIFYNKDKRCIILYYQNNIYLNRKNSAFYLYFKEYYLNYELHRENGPAIENFVGNEKYKYYLNGTKLTKKEYQIKLRKLKIKRLNVVNFDFL